MPELVSEGGDGAPPGEPEVLAVHSPFGSLPALALTHVAPALSTTWQVVHEAIAAHSFCVCPWMQLPLVHSLPAAQPVPLAFLLRHIVPPTQ